MAAAASLAALVVASFGGATVHVSASAGVVTAQQKQLAYIASTFEENQPQLAQPAALHAYERFARRVVAQANPPVPKWKLLMLADELAARLHDQHAYVMLPTSAKTLPVGFYWASDGIVVVPVPHAPRGLTVGDRVVRVGNLTVADLKRRIADLLNGNAELRRFEAGNDLPDGDFLHALGVVAPDGTVKLTLRRASGKEYTVRPRLLPMREVRTAATARLSAAFAARYLSLDGLPSTDGRAYAWRVVPRQHYGVFWLSQCTPSRELNQSIGRFFAQVEADHIQNVVLDVDFNPGGMGTIVNAFLRYLPMPSAKGYYTLDSFGDTTYLKLPHPATPAVYRGKVYVLTNWGTCSAAVLFADILATNGLATTVGQPTGGNPEATSNPQSFPVPGGSLTVVSANMRLLDSALNQTDSPTLRPEVYAPVTVEDIQRGVNPLDQWAASLVGAAPAGSATRSKMAAKSK